jgi:hypothetical protein
MMIPRYLSLVLPSHPLPTAPLQLPGSITWYNDFMHAVPVHKGGLPMGDKGGRKGKEKSQKQKTEKHIHDVQAQKDKQQKSPFDIKSR